MIRLFVFRIYIIYKLDLNKRGEGVAIVSEVSSEALAQARVVVTLSAATALIRVEVSDIVSGARIHDIGNIGVEVIVFILQIKSSELGCAAIVALVVLYSEEVLSPLHSATSECHLHFEHVKVINITVHGVKLRCAVSTLRILNSSIDLIERHGHSVDHLVRKGEQSELNIVSHVNITSATSSASKHNRDGGERLVQLARESESECLTIKILDRTGIVIIVCHKL